MPRNPAWWASLGFGVTGLFWLFAAFAYQMDPLSLVGMTIVAIGGFLALSAARGFPERIRARFLVGLFLVLVGGVAFFLANFLPPQFSAYLVAILAYDVGLAVAVVGVFRARNATSRVALRVARAGAGLAAVGPLMWSYLDAAGGSWGWEPGNLTALASTLLLAWAAR